MKRNLRVWLCAAGFFLCPAAAIAADFPSAGATLLSVPVFLEDRQRDVVPVLIAKDVSQSYVQAGPVIALLKPILPADKMRALEAAETKGFLHLSDIAKSGIDIRFDNARVALVITIPAENKGQQSLSALHQFDLANKTITPPSDLSAYLNFRGSQDYVESTTGNERTGRQPFRLSSDGAVNLKGWVLEGSGNYIEGDAHEWQRGDTRLVHDLPDSMVRLAAGDLSYPVEGLQSFQPMLGVTVARDFDLQPYRVSEPTGQTSFFLNSPSRVDIYVNGRKTQTLQLNSGPFDIKDFPVTGGSNDVQLVITDATGRVEIKNIDIVSDVNLLAAGLNKYAYNVGVISTNTNGTLHYQTDKPVFSAFHRYGLTDTITLGANMQADQDQQMAGAEATFGGKLGILRTDLAGSNLNNGGGGFAVQEQYEISSHANAYDRDGNFNGVKNFTLLTRYQDKNFAPLGLITPNNQLAYEFAARYTQQLSPTLNFGLSSRYDINRMGFANDWNYGASISHQLPQNFRLDFDIEDRHHDGMGAFLTLTWTPQGSRSFASTSYDSFSHTERADYNYAADGRTDSFSAGAGVARVDGSDQATGNLTYYNNRGEFTVRHDVATPYANNSALSGTESRSQVQFGTALAFSGGHVALSRPISDSFAMVAAHPALDDYTIGVNPQGSSNGDDNKSYEAETDILGPAVLPNVTPYMYRTLRIDAGTLPPGFDSGAASYTLSPTYRSGTLIKVGGDANVLLDGTLQYPDGKPVELQAGSIQSVTDSSAAPQTFFTNRRGRFRIEQLKPGPYAIELYGLGGTTLPVTIPDGAAGMTKAGIITVPTTAAVLNDTDHTHSGAWTAAPQHKNPEDAP